MTNNMNPTVYTDDARFLELLERWLQGDFTRGDERELRALAETDAFRREAWEGFLSLPEANHKTHLETIRRNLQHRPAGRRIPIGMWTAAAALFILLIAAIYFLPQWNEKETAPMAQSAEQTPTAPATSQALTDSAVAGESLAVADESAGMPRVAPTPRTEHLPLPAGRAKAADEVLSSSEKSRADKPEERKMATQPSPVPPAGELSRPADTNNTFPGGPAANVVLTKPADTDIVQVKEDAESPDRRLAEGKKKADRVAAAQQKQPAVPDPFSSGATPAGGWEEFNRYLRRNARLTDAARNNNVSGNVRLQFMVGQDGKPANIRILQTLGYGCDEEAIRLIQSVYWTPGGPGATTLDIPFVR